MFSTVCYHPTTKMSNVYRRIMPLVPDYSVHKWPKFGAGDNNVRCSCHVRVAWYVRFSVCRSGWCLVWYVFTHCSQAANVLCIAESREENSDNVEHQMFWELERSLWREVSCGLHIQTLYYIAMFSTAWVSTCRGWRGWGREGREDTKERPNTFRCSHRVAGAGPMGRVSGSTKSTSPSPYIDHIWYLQKKGCWWEWLWWECLWDNLHEWW